MGGTHRLKWKRQQLVPPEPDVHSRGWWRSSLQKTATKAALSEQTTSKQRVRLSDLLKAKLWASWNAAQFTQKENPDTIVATECQSMPIRCKGLRRRTCTCGIPSLNCPCADHTWFFLFYCHCVCCTIQHHCVTQPSFHKHVIYLKAQTVQHLKHRPTVHWNKNTGQPYKDVLLNIPAAPLFSRTTPDSTHTCLWPTPSARWHRA